MEPYIKAMLERVKKKMQDRPPMEPRHPVPQDGIYCDKCRCSGWIAVTEANGTVAMAHCPKCWERRQVVRRLKQSGINPKDYEKYTLESFDGDRSDMAGKMKAMAGKYLKEHTKGGPGIGIFGRSGMGKTHICIAVCQELTRTCGEPHYYFSYRSEMPTLVKASRSFIDDYADAMENGRLARISTSTTSLSWVAGSKMAVWSMSTGKSLESSTTSSMPGI